ncbi:Ig-like domain-containing protein [Colwellia echini]|uniref:BIG2 domain-containing protein n=1 Tax=Colwellia echini TaxID=1982103 RepID=A0ABY3N191_9GAMM|nr:Ig-like domain-containing protein [Colwellia echini]TYK67260.1 hypothetical protein CWS31_001685 [Colwellia echini]
MKALTKTINVMRIKKSRKYSVFLSFVIALTSSMLTGCDTDNNSAELANAVEVESLFEQGLLVEEITIKGAHTRIKAGETQQLNAIGITNGGTNVDVTNDTTWSSSDITIATVDENGLVTGIANSEVNQGIVIITATSNSTGISGEGQISVSDVVATGIKLNQPMSDGSNINTCIAVGITGDVTYADGYISMNTASGMSFSVDEASTATIDSNGILNTSSANIETTSITATLDEFTDTLSVTASPVNLDVIDILFDDEIIETSTLAMGERMLVNGQITLTTGETLYNIDTAINWLQADGSYLGITSTGDNKGTVLALRTGDTQLIGNCGGKQTAVTMTVTGEDDIESIEINQDLDIYIEPLGSIELTLTADYTDSSLSSLNVSEFAYWSIEENGALKGEYINLGTDTASYKVTSIIDEASDVTVTATYNGEVTTTTINIEELSSSE